MIDFSKPVQTRDGCKVRILTTDARSVRPVVGLILRKDGGEEIASWSEEGSCGIPFDLNLDLINLPRRIDWDVWVNIYPHPGDGIRDFAVLHPTKTMADQVSSGTRLACVKVHISCVEGEGLQ